jgi:hypothetical protein
MLDYIFSNLYTSTTIYQHNGDASPENSTRSSYYAPLIMTLYRSKHVEGTYVTNDNLLLIVQFVGSNSV